MNKIIFHTLLLIGLVISSSQTVWCQEHLPSQKVCQIKFDPQKYIGPYFFEENDIPKKGIITLPFKPNDDGKPFYVMEIGSKGYTNSQISFVVSQNCKVSQYEISNKPSAVKFKGKTVKFKNVSVVIDPQNYTGDYYFKGFFAYAPYNYTPSKGKNTFAAVPNVDSFISIYGTGTFTEINFNIGDDGTLSGVTNFTAASACGNTLKLNNIKISVDPTTFTESYRLGGQNYRGPQSNLVFIPGIRLQIDIRRINDSVRYVTPWVTHIEPNTIDVPDSDTTFQKFKFSLNP